MNSTSPSTGSASARRQSRRGSPASIWATVRWCSTTCRELPGGLEGRCCELAKLGYNRDGKKGKLQIVYGLLCAADGCPVAIEVFEGNTADPRTLAIQIDKIKARFALRHVVMVGDRGMITQARLDAEIAAAGLDWMTALRAPAIRALAESGALQMSLFDERDMAAITSPDFLGERLIVCRNPDLARERTCKRPDLLPRPNAISPKS